MATYQKVLAKCYIAINNFEYEALAQNIIIVIDNFIKTNTK